MIQHFGVQAQKAFQPANDEARDPTAAIGVRVAYHRGQEIYAQEDMADLIYRVVSGAVRTTRLQCDGRRQIGDFYYPGDFFGIETGDEHRFSAEALEDCEILVVKRKTLGQQGGDSERLERLVWLETARQLVRAQEHLMLLGRKGACERVATFLLDMVGRFGGEFTALPMGRQDMADYLGLTIETVSRTLTHLQAEGLVEFAGCRRFRIKRQSAMADLAA